MHVCDDNNSESPGQAKVVFGIRSKFGDHCTSCEAVSEIHVLIRSEINPTLT